MTPCSGPIAEIARIPGRFLAALNRGPLVLDAALGTRLIARGLDLRSDDPSLWNRTHPADVLDLHERDVSAGSQALFSNTFGANRLWLANFGRADSVEDINRRAVALARRAIGPDWFRRGRHRPHGRGRSSARRPSRRRSCSMRASTPSSSRPIVPNRCSACSARSWRPSARRCRSSPVSGSGRTRRRPPLDGSWTWASRPSGSIVSRASTRRSRWPVVWTVRSPRAPSSSSPSASGEESPNSRSTPSAFAAAVPQLLEWNVRLLGGCCGTTEAHVSALASACSSYQHLNRNESIGVGP